MIPLDLELFLEALFARGKEGFITFTAKKRGQSTPSRHVRLGDRAGLQCAVADLLATNRLGWSAYVAIGLRRANLGRWRRGGDADLLALPALYADLDRPPDEALPQVQAYQPPPSCLVASGSGLHIYWWLQQPTTDFARAKRILRQLAADLDGDRTSLSQSMRLVASRNPKPGRNNARCRILTLSDRYCTLDDFRLPELRPQPRPFRRRRTSSSQHFHGQLNPLLVQRVTDELFRSYGAFHKRDSDWIGALCPCGHAQDSPGSHFFWNPRIGCGKCWGRHGVLRLVDMCEVLGIDPQSYGGVYTA